MTKHKHRWTYEEEQALHAGVEKYGTGKWKEILKDPRYSAILVDRSNIDLKDKWRNLRAALTGSRSSGKVKTLTRGKTTNKRLASPVPLAVINPIEYGGGSRTEYGGGSRTEHGDGSCIKYGGNSRTEYGGGSVIKNGDGFPIKHGGPRIEQGGTSVKEKPPRQYTRMVVKALASTEDPNGNGLNSDAVCYSIEKKYELPPFFRRSIKARLRKLEKKGFLEKVGDCYKFNYNRNKEDAKPAAAAETEKKIASTAANLVVEAGNKEDAEPAAAAAEKEEKIASTAANLVVEAENKRLAAIKACEKADKLAELLEESKAMLKIAEEMYQQCERKGHVLLVN